MAALEEDAEEAAEKAVDEKRHLDDAWKELVKSVLSSIRIDPKSRGKQFEFFLPYEGEVTPEQVKALQHGNYGNAFGHLLRLWKALPELGRPELYEVAELFKSLSVVTGSPYREIKHLEKNKPLEQLDVLRKMSFLSNYSWSENKQFDVDDLGEQLNTYIRFGIEWPDIEHKLLQMCVARAADENKAKGKPLSETVGEKLVKKNVFLGVVTMMSMMLTGFLLPILFWLAIDVGVLYWSLNHLSGENASIWAYAGLGWIVITVPASIIYYGTTEIRHSLRKIIQPGWDRFSPTMNADLVTLRNTVNGYRVAHTNLRLVRQLLIRLQTTDIKIPVQLLTLIDRAIAKGDHHW
jgi:hypothetical protein